MQMHQGKINIGMSFSPNPRNVKVLEITHILDLCIIIISKLQHDLNSLQKKEKINVSCALTELCHLFVNTK